MWYKGYQRAQKHIQRQMALHVNFPYKAMTGALIYLRYFNYE